MDGITKSKGCCSSDGSHVVLACLGLWAVLNMEAQRQIAFHTVPLLTNQTRPLEQPPKEKDSKESPAKHKNISFIPLNLEACFNKPDSWHNITNQTIAPSLNKSLNYSGPEMVLVGAYDVGYGVLQIPAVIMIVCCCGVKCRWPCAEITLAIGQAVAAMATILMPFIDMLPLVAAVGLRFLAGAGGACCLPMLYSVFCKYHPRGHATGWLCLSLTGIPLGMNLAHSLSRVCAEELQHPKLAFYILGGTGLLWQVLWIMFTRCQAYITKHKKTFKQGYQRLAFCFVVKSRVALVLVITHITAVFTQVLLTTRGHIFIHLHPQRDYIVSVTYFSEGVLVLISAFISHRLSRLDKWNVTFLRKSSELIGRIIIVSALIAMSITKTVNCTNWEGTVVMWMIATIAQGLMYTGYMMVPLDAYPGNVGILMATMGTMGAAVRVTLFYTEALQRPLLITANHGGPDIPLYVCIVMIGVSTVVFVKCGTSEALDLQEAPVIPVTKKPPRLVNGPEILNQLQGGSQGQGHAQNQGHSVTFSGGFQDEANGQDDGKAKLLEDIKDGEVDTLSQPKVPCDECKPTHVCETLPKVQRKRQKSGASTLPQSVGSRPGPGVPSPGERGSHSHSPMLTLDRPGGQMGREHGIGQAKVSGAVSKEWDKRNLDPVQGCSPELNPDQGRQQYRASFDRSHSGDHSSPTMLADLGTMRRNQQGSPMPHADSKYY